MSCHIPVTDVLALNKGPRARASKPAAPSTSTPPRPPPCRPLSLAMRALHVDPSRLVWALGRL